MTDEARWPVAWRGQWSADDGKTVRIEEDGERLLVTVAPTPDGDPYRSAELLEGDTKAIERLAATCFVDDKGRMYLEIEAGTPELGPTYCLYAAIEDENRKQRVASPDTAVAELVLIPNTSIGLYDDWEDDLGVPWALPLAPMRHRRMLQC